jgi:hypothetical protein
MRFSRVFGRNFFNLRIKVRRINSMSGHGLGQELSRAVAALATTAHKPAGLSRPEPRQFLGVHTKAHDV